MIKKLIISITAFTVLLTLFVTTVIYTNDAILFDAVDKIDGVIWPHQRLLGKLRHQVGHIIDELNPLRSEANILSALEVYELELSPQDVRKLLIDTDQEYVTSGYQKPGQSYRKVGVRFNGVKHSAKMKLHGDDAIHWSGKKKSFQIKFAKDDYVNNRRRYLFLIPENRHYLTAMFASGLAKKLNLPFVENRLVAVKMNSLFQGIYYVEEHLNKKFLERHNISNGVIVELTDNWIEDRRMAKGDAEQYYGGITYNDHHNTPFNLEISNLKEIQSEYGQVVYKKTMDLFAAVKAGDIESFEALIDIKRVGAIDAWRTLLGDRHSIVGDNNKMVYSLTSGKFFFLPRSEGDLRPLVYSGGSFITELNKKAGRIIPLLEMLARSEKITHVRNEWLYYFVEHKQELLSLYDSLSNQYLSSLKQDATLPHSSRELAYMIRKDRSIVESNLSRLKRQFEYAKAYVNVVAGKNSVVVTIIPDTSLQALVLEKLKIVLHQKEGHGDETVKILKLSESDALGELVAIHKGPLDIDFKELFGEERFGFNLNRELLLSPKEHRFRFIYEHRTQIDVEHIEIGFLKEFSKDQLSEDDVYVTIADEKNDLSNLKFQSAESFLARYPQFNWVTAKNHFILKAGSYLILDHVIVPEGLILTFEAGVELSLAPRTVFLSYSPLNMIGSEAAPIFIRASDPDQPFGVFAVLGDESRALKLSYVDVSGGSEAFVNGLFLSGALSLYHTDAELDHVNIHNNVADDGLNIKYGRITITDSLFTNNAVDQVDLDFTQGQVLNSTFIISDTRNHDNGDGIDVSGSELLIRNSHFKNLHDKGISVGEASKVLLFENEIENNQVGVAVKDSSHVLLLKNQLHENKIAVSCYQKKPIFDGGHTYAALNDWNRNKKRFFVDDRSRLYTPSEWGSTYFNTLTLDSGTFSFEEIFSEKNWTHV